MPIGPDPESGLHEFAVIQTGTIPVRGADGHFTPDKSTAVVLALLPGGRFGMGAQSLDPKERQFDPTASAREIPVHDVDLSPFYIAKYELTQAQWLTLDPENPANYPDALQFVTLKHAVESITWFEARERLSRAGLVLPTEAQWEYAARSGTTTPWYTGAERESLRGAANIADASGGRAGANWGGIADWPELDDGFPIHAPVGSFIPNAFALYDIHGNVSEWCYDGYVAASYRPGRGLDPVNEEDGSGRENRGATRVLRGGNYSKAAKNSTVSSRNPFTPSRALETIGVRPARRL